MKHALGLNEFNFKQKKIESQVVYDPGKLINGHLLLCGMSGTGKSFQAGRLLGAAAQSGVAVDVFDVHDEFSSLSHAHCVMYSQATGYGYNPLELDTDIHVGGVDRNINFLVSLVREITPQFGSKQESCLRYLLRDTYAAAGITQKNTDSWRRKSLTELEREVIVRANQWSRLREFYPTMEDLRSYAKRKIYALMLGGDNPSISALDATMKSVSRLYAAQKKYSKGGADGDIEKLEKNIQTLKEKALDTYDRFLEKMETGREIDDVIKYDSVDVLSGVIQRLDNLDSAGIFRPNRPDFGRSKVHVHQIKSLSNDQQVLFVKLRLSEIFNECKKTGMTSSGTELRRVVFLEEAHKYFSSEPSDIINIIAKEGRKFGLGLWCASQQPTEFPESFVSNVGATILLGIHASFWKRSSSLLRISEDTLKWIRPKEVLSLKMQNEGQSDPAFVNVIVPNPKTEGGRRAAQVVEKSVDA